MEVRQLEAFRATVICGTASGAAAMLGVSQPAVSRMIIRLETQLKLVLFNRKGGRLSPTPEALILYDHVEKSFATFEKIREVAADIRNARVGQLTVATMPAIAASLLPEVVRQFKETHPRVSLSVEVHTSAKVDEWAFAQHIDLGIAEFPQSRSGLETETFCRTPLWLVAPADHPLAAHAQVGPAEIGVHPFIALPRPEANRWRLDRAFERAGLHLEPIVEVQNYAFMCDLVSCGLGVALVDPFTAISWRTRGLTMVEFCPSIEFHVGVLHPVHRPMSRPASSFLSILRRVRSDFLEQLKPI